MSVNLSTFSDSPPHPNLAFINYQLSHLMRCLMSKPNSAIINSFYVTCILLLSPLCTFVLYLGVQQWRRQRSTSSSAATMSHSDSFTYHLAALELFAVCGYVSCCLGIYRVQAQVILAGLHLWAFAWFGETFLHILTCVERYLAVVHPVVYLGLRGERGVRIRNTAIGFVWLLSCAGMSLVLFDGVFFPVCLFLLSFAFIIILYCNFAVLRVLIRRGPGEQGGDRERVDRSKQRAFYTITAILGVLLLRFVCQLIWAIFNMLRKTDCLPIVLSVWFTVPCSLLLQLLFLCRAGNLACGNNISGEKGLA